MAKPDPAITVTPAASAVPEPTPMEVLTAAMANLANLVAQGIAKPSDAENIRKIMDAQKKDSPAFHGKSCFEYPEGKLAAEAAGKFKKLDRIIWLTGIRQREEDLTVREVDAYNSFSRTLPGPHSRREARNGQWTATVSADNKELRLVVPFNTEDLKANIPPTLELLLLEFEQGPDATDPNMLIDSARKLKEMEARFADLEAKMLQMAR